MKQLTIVYQIENQEHQTALLCAPNILRVSHNDSILELTKAAGLALHQQNEIDNLHRGAALLRERLNQSEESRKAAQIENEQLKKRIAHGDGEMRERISRQSGEIMELQAMLDSIGAGGVESLRKSECLHQTMEPQQKPVAFGSAEEFASSDDPHCKDGGEACINCLMCGECLYKVVEQPPAPAHQPLTDEELAGKWLSVRHIVHATDRQIAFARAIESAHGIINKGETK